MLSGHLVPLSEFVVKPEQKIGMDIGPVLIKDSVQVDLGFLEILALKHHRRNHDVHFF